MTRPTHITTACLLLLFVTAACSKPVQNSASTSATTPAGTPALAEDKHITSVDVVKVAALPVEMAAGSSSEATVRLTIQNGYHINANPPTYSYLRATELEIAPVEGISVGHSTYPKPLNRKFPFAEKPLAVYEGETEVKATLKADKSVKQGQQSLTAKLRIQACDDQLCYPPGTLDLVIPVSIK